MDSFDDLQIEELEQEFFQLAEEIEEVKKELAKQQVLAEQKEEQEVELRKMLLDYDIEFQDLDEALVKILSLREELQKELSEKVAEIKDALGLTNDKS